MFGFNNGLGNALGYNVIGGMSVEDLFKNKSGKLYIVDKNLISSYSNFSAIPTYGETVATLADISKGVVDTGSVSTAKQTTLSKRPIYAVSPKNGRKNILNFSNKLSQSPWSKSSIASQIEIDDENNVNGFECYKLTSLPNTYGNSYVFQNVVYSNTAHKMNYNNGIPSITVSIYTKVLKRGVLTRNFSISLKGLYDGDVSVKFDFNDTANITYISNDPSTTANVVYLDDGWRRLSITKSVDFDNINTYVNYGMLDAVNGDGSQMSISSPQIEYSLLATKYQDVNNYFDIKDDDGYNIEHLIFDGIDDSIVMPVDSSLYGSIGDIIIVGVKKSFIIPYKFDNDITIGPRGIGDNIDDLIEKTGGIVAFGYVTPQLSAEEYQDFFDVMDKRGASGNYDYDKEMQIVDILRKYTGEWDVFWPKIDRLYKDTNFTIKTTGAGETIRGWMGYNGTRIITNIGYNPYLMKLPYGMKIRNFADYSENFDKYQKSSNMGKPPIVFSKYSIDPFNEMKADRIIFDIVGATSNNNHSTMTIPESLVAGKTYTASFWGKSNVKGQNYGVTFAFANILPEPSPMIFTDTWQRFTITGVATASNNSPYLRLRQNINSTKYADVSVFGYQIEEGSVATDYQKKEGRFNCSENGKTDTYAMRMDNSFLRSHSFYTVGPEFSIIGSYSSENVNYKQVIFGNAEFKIFAINDVSSKKTGFTIGSNVIEGLMKPQAFSVTYRAVKRNTQMSYYENGSLIQNLTTTAYTPVLNNYMGFYGAKGNAANNYTDYLRGYGGPIIITKNFVPTDEDLTRIENILQEFSGARNV